MNYNKIRKMAKEMGIKTHQAKKTDLILSIQRKENNIDCFGTPRVDYCNEEICLWRDDCVSTNQVLNGANPA